jgi:hypothetical protein
VWAVTTLVWKGAGVSENAMMTISRGTDAGGVLLGVVAAVDYLSATHRLGLTVWEGVEEALRWWTTDRLTLPGEIPDDDFADLPWGDDPDPLRTAMERLFACTSGAGGPDGLELGAVLITALDNWVRQMAVQYNDGHSFAHPAPRHGWPSPLYDTTSDAATEDEW